MYILGNNFTYSSSDFGRGDVYNTIQAYLSAGMSHIWWNIKFLNHIFCLCVIETHFPFLPLGSEVRCYNASNPELNSTAWFVIYINSFVTFITLDDLASFVPISQVCASFPNQLSGLENQPAKYLNLIHYLSFLDKDWRVFSKPRELGSLQQLSCTWKCNQLLPDTTVWIQSNFQPFEVG